VSPLPATAAKGPKAQPTRVGGARPSHLVTTGGTGSIVDLPGMSVIVRGTESWPLERAETITEPRLLAKIKASLGPQVTALRTAPWDPLDSDDAWTRTGVPVCPFPGGCGALPVTASAPWTHPASSSWCTAAAVDPTWPSGCTTPARSKPSDATCVNGPACRRVSSSPAPTGTSTISPTSTSSITVAPSRAAEPSSCCATAPTHWGLG